MRNISYGLSGPLTVNIDLLLDIMRLDGYHVLDIPYGITLSVEPYLHSIFLSGNFCDYEFHGNYSNGARYIYIDKQSKDRITPSYHNGILYTKSKDGATSIIDSDILVDNGYDSLPIDSSSWNEDMYVMLKLTV